MTDIEAIITREFQRLAERGQEKGAEQTYRTLEDKAEALGTNKSTLSRIFNRKIRLSPETAAKFARRLRGDDAVGCSLVTRELLDASQSSDEPHIIIEQHRFSYGDIHAAKAYFDTLQAGCLNVVEYRDHPRASSYGKYASYADFAGQAVAKGLYFAMVVPFGGTNDNPHLPQRVRHYLWELKQLVTDARRKIVEAAKRHVEATAADGQQDSNMESLLADIEKRVVLYETNSGAIPFVSGIQSRLFYAEIKRLEGKEKIVSEWVAAKDRDFFITREESATPPDVIADQFFPIVRYWRELGILPTTNEELDSAIQKYGKDTDINSSLPKGTWRLMSANG